MENKILHNLTDVSETLLIPLWARAVETKRDHPIIKDTKSIEIMEQIDYDFSKYKEEFNDRIHFIEEWNYFDFHKDRWRWLRWIALIPLLKNNFNNKIVHLGFTRNL